MANYALYFNNNFSACRLLAYAYDQHRNREVRVFQIPGEVETVGVTDGVDKWIAPTIANPFNVDVQGLIKRIMSGEQVKVVDARPSQIKPARRVLLDDPPPNPPARTRKRLLGDPGESQPQIRRHLLIN